MDFSLTNEQRDIKKAAAEFAAKEFLPEVAMDHELNHRFPRELFRKAAHLGFIGLDYPEKIVGLLEEEGLGGVEQRVPALLLVLEADCALADGHK